MPYQRTRALGENHLLPPSSLSSASFHFFSQFAHMPWVVELSASGGFSPRSAWHQAQIIFMPYSPTLGQNAQTAPIGL